jgi:hypothetical protein
VYPVNNGRKYAFLRLLKKKLDISEIRKSPLPRILDLQLSGHMFLQNVGANTKKKSKPKTEGGGDSAASTPLLEASRAQGQAQAQAQSGQGRGGADIITMLQGDREVVKIQYREGGTGIPRDVLLGFLVGCVAEMREQENISRIVDICEATGAPLSAVGMEFQRVTMESVHGIEKMYGCKYLARIPAMFPTDEELIEAGSNFIAGCMFFFLAGIRERGKRVELPLKSTGTIPTPVMHDFFEGCNALMQDPPVKAELRTIARETGQPPNERIIALQRSVLELLGYEADFGCAQLNKLGQTHSNDRMLIQRFQQFVMGAQTAVHESMMTDEAHKEWLRKIPAFMQHTPHMYAMQMQQQERMMQQQEAQRQQGGGMDRSMDPHDHRSHDHNGHDHGHGQPAHTGAYPSQAQQQAVMRQLAQDPERVAKLATVQGKMTTIAEELRGELATMRQDERKEFVRDFALGGTLKKLNANPDPAGRLEVFSAMSDGEMRAMVKFQKIVQEDQQHGGGSLGVKTVFSKAASDATDSVSATASASASGGVMGAISGLMSGLGLGGGGAAAGAQTQAAHSHSHSHSHGHSHGGSCSAHGPVTQTGGTQTMER